MLLFNSKALLSQWKPRDAAVNCEVPKFTAHRTVVPAIARFLSVLFRAVE